MERALLLYGDGGTILRTTDRWSGAATALTLDPGQPGDAALAAFLDTTLPAHIRDWSEIGQIRAELNGLKNRRAALDILRANTEARLRELASFPYAEWRREGVRLGLEGFLAVCRGAEASADVTTACLQAWRAQQTDGETWWRTLADQVPPGVLILFLLATMGGLYRYNLRLAGFHDSRADALELLAQGRSVAELQGLLAATPADAVNLASVFLAADKVEMGAVKARLGAAEVELARALSERRP